MRSDVDVAVTLLCRCGGELSCIESTARRLGLIDDMLNAFGHDGSESVRVPVNMSKHGLARLLDFVARSDASPNASEEPDALFAVCEVRLLSLIDRHAARRPRCAAAHKRSIMLGAILQLGQAKLVAY